MSLPTVQLAWRSLWNRRATAILTVLAIAISVALLLGVQKLRAGAREGFANTVSGVDLIVGSRTGPLNLLLYSIFRVGDATANVSWESYQRIARHPDVAWAIPFSLGDSHRGFRVLGTTRDYFEHYRFGGADRLGFSAGEAFDDLYDAVLGADVAATLGYRLGDPLVLSHGVGEVSFTHHDDQPFRVSGVLARTGTPVDRTVHVSLQAITALHSPGEHHAAEDEPEHHADEDSAKHHGHEEQAAHHDEQAPHQDNDRAAPRDLTPQSISAFLLGMRSKPMTLTMQRAINEYRPEPLSAILPGVALTQLWSLVGVADTALMVVAAFVVLAGLIGMLAAILTSLNERRREMAILRSVGARPQHIFALLMAEAGLIAACGAAIGVALTYTALFAARPVLAHRFGVLLPAGGLSRYDLMILGGIVLAALCMALLPAWRAYRNTLDDGLTIRI